MELISRTATLNIQKFYMVFTLPFKCSVWTFNFYVINRLVFIGVVESVYSAVRTDSLYKALS